MSPKKQLESPAQIGPIYTWPDGVSELTGLSTVTLQRMRSQGDAPALYAITERSLVTTGADLLAWVRSKSVPVGYKCRPATTRRKRAPLTGQASAACPAQ